MKRELEKKVAENTLLIDELISTYFSKNLKKDRKQVMTPYMIKGKLSFSQKVKLFCDLVTMSKMDKAKFKVYAKINNDLSAHDILDPNFFQKTSNYHTFLLNTYLTATDNSPVQEKLFSATNRLSNNIVRLTKIYTEKPEN